MVATNSKVTPALVSRVEKQITGWMKSCSIFTLPNVTVDTVSAEKAIRNEIKSNNYAQPTTIEFKPLTVQGSVIGCTFLVSGNVDPKLVSAVDILPSGESKTGLIMFNKAVPTDSCSYFGSILAEKLAEYVAETKHSLTSPEVKSKFTELLESESANFDFSRIHVTLLKRFIRTR